MVIDSDESMHQCVTAGSRVVRFRQPCATLIEEKTSAMSDEQSPPNNAEILSALQGMWRQQKDLIVGVESRLSSKLEGVVGDLGRQLETTEQRLANRLSQEIQDRPVVVHIDMSRVTELEKQLEALSTRVAQLEARTQ
jgi:ubiquinone biosynthesis protein UbiJ